MVANWISAIPTVLVLLVHLVLLVVAIVLLVRTKGTPAILAVAAFVLLFLVDIGRLMRVLFLERMIYTGSLSYAATGWVTTGLSCCCSLVDIIAVVCLLIAIWQAVSGSKAAPAEVEPETPVS